MQRFSLMLVGGLAAGVLLSGCQEGEVRTYQVPKPEVVRPRLLAAILPRDERIWFFKFSGPEKLLGEQEKAFQQFLDSVHFSDKGEKPLTWTLPAGWREEPGKGLRYATIYAGPGRVPELTVHSLGREASSVLDNINRWRGQIGLEPIAQDELARVTREIKIDGQAATCADMTGSPPGQPAQPRTPTFQVPEGWTARSPLPPMAVKAFQAVEGDQTALVTVTPLSGPAGGLAANVNRWRNQVGLPPAKEADLEKDLQMIEVGGARAASVDLTGPEGAGGKPRQRILGVMVLQAGESWFFKMQGPADLVEKQKPAFDAFVRSVRFGKATGAK